MVIFYQETSLWLNGDLTNMVIFWWKTGDFLTDQKETTHQTGWFMNGLYGFKASHVYLHLKGLSRPRQIATPTSDYGKSLYPMGIAREKKGFKQGTLEGM